MEPKVETENQEITEIKKENKTNGDQSPSSVDSLKQNL